MSQATLSLLADSSQIKTATNDLKSLSNEGAKTQTTAQRIEQQFTKLTTASKSAADSASAFANALTTVNQDLSEARNNIENFISDQIKLGRKIDENGNVISASGNKIDALSDDLQRLRSEYLNTSNQSDELADAMNRINSATDKNQAAAYEARLKHMALADAAQDVTSALKSQGSAMGKVETEYSRLVAQSNAANAAMSRSSGAMAAVSRNAGMAGIQIQQFVGQIQGGQSAMLALSQQGADLGFVLGAPLAGAIIGIGASLTSFLIPALMGATSDVEELRERIEYLGDTAEKTVIQIKFLAQENEKAVNELSKSNEGLAESLLSAREELEKLTSAGTGLDTGDFAVPRSAEENQRRYAERIDETRKRINELTAEIDTNNQEIIKLNTETTKLGDASEEVSQKSLNLTTSLQAQIIALQGGAQAAEVYAATQNAIQQGTESLLPKQIELINQKYELKRAQEAAAESAKLEIEQQKAYESVLDQIIAKEKQRQAAEAAAEANRINQLQSVASGTIGLTDLQAIEQQYQSEQDLLKQAQAEGIQSKISYEERLTQLQQEYSEKRNQIITAEQNTAVKFISDGTSASLSAFASTLGNLASIASQGGEESFQAYKNLASAQAAISATLSVLAVLGDPSIPTVARIPLATSIGALAAANVVMIQKQEYNGARAVGGSVYKNGSYLVGERGPELFTPNSSGGGRITPFNQLMNESGKGAASTNVMVNVTNNATNSDVNTEERQDAQGNRVIDIVVNNINQRGKIHKAMTQTTTAGNRI